MNIIVAGEPVVTARAWRVRFGTPTSEGDFDRLVADAPRPLVAERREFDVAEALAASPTERDATDLLIIWIPPGANDIETPAERWIAARPPMIRASISTIRALWSNNRVVLFCNSELFEAGYDAIVRFTAVAREADWLEKQVASSWRSINDHKRLVHSPSFSAPRKAVNAATEQSIETEMSLMSAEMSLEQLDPKLDATSKRLFGELVLAANLHDRLEMLVGPIEFASAHYETVSSRLIDAETTRKGLWLEILIALLLMVNTGMMFISPGKEPAQPFETSVGVSNAEMAAKIEKRPESAESAGAPIHNAVGIDSGTGAKDAETERAAPAQGQTTNDLDAAGCEAKLTLVSSQKRILFAKGASSLPAASTEALRGIGEVLKQCREEKISVKARFSTGEVPSAKLTQGREQSVISYLIREGVQTNMLKRFSVGAGKKPESNRANERSVEFGSIEFIMSPNDGRP
jgi:outer membrane protein OmpA-like peptidoglycan-associated protein